MEPTLNPDELRELFLSIAEPGTARALALGGSLLLVVVVLWLVRRRSLREEFTPIWMAVAFALAVLSVRLDWLRWLTRAVGAWTPSSVIFFLGEVFLVVVCLNYAVRLSKAGVEIKNLAQEVALLRTRLDRIEPSADAEL
jgi:tellurite resistance protein TehA-like permease